MNTRKLLAIVVVLSLTTPLYAGGWGTGWGHHKGCDKKGHKDNKGKPGPQGPVGPQGPSGQNGENGQNGLNGEDGQNGKDGATGAQGPQGDSANIDHTLRVNMGAEVTWYDWKSVALKSGYKYDFNHHDNTVDALVVQFKVGPSYEQRRIKEQETQIAALSAAVLALQLQALVTETFVIQGNDDGVFAIPSPKKEKKINKEKGLKADDLKALMNSHIANEQGRNK